MTIKLGAQTQTHGEEFKSLDQANHGSPARFTWRSRFREARDQDSLWFVSYVSKRKGGRQVGGGEGGQVSFKKKKMTLEQAFCLERQHVNVPLDTK